MKVDLLLARAQVALAFVLIGVFFSLTLLVLLLIGHAHITLDGATGALVNMAETASITMASGAVGYFFLRQRHTETKDPLNPTENPTTEENVK
jgi:hypothetical protein